MHKDVGLFLKATEEMGLSVFVHPARHSLPCFTEAEETKSAERYQSRLLALRMTRYAQVKEFELGKNETFPRWDDQQRTWLAAISECKELRTSMLAILARCRDDFAGTRFDDLKCLVAEAALMFCHRKEAQYFFVREATEKVNDLLLGRHVDLKLSDRMTGSLLRKLGIPASRVTKGFRVELNEATRRQIHEVAKAYEVLSLKKGAIRCAHCENETSPAPAKRRYER